MNERIKKLAEQAGSTHKQNLGVYQFYSDELAGIHTKTFWN
jgi:hypothetical protein